MQRIEATTEEVVIPVLAYVAIAINILVCILLRSDTDMRISSRIIVHTFLVAQMFYLASVAAYLKVKELGFNNDLEVMNYATIPLGVCQMIAVWTLLLLVSDSHKCLKYFNQKRRLTSPCGVAAKTLLLVLLVLIFHVPYVPQIRVILYKLCSVLTPCSTSLADHWELAMPEKNSPIDTYYVAYFCFAHIFFTYTLPYFLIGK